MHRLWLPKLLSKVLRVALPMRCEDLLRLVHELLVVRLDRLQRLEHVGHLNFGWLRSQVVVLIKLMLALIA